jgi:Domain of unknown function (DUF4136)
MIKFASSFRKSALLAAPLALMVMSGCAPTPFRADVSRFQQLPPAQGQSFAIKAANAANDGGIEFGQYASLVSAEMQKLGYVPSGGANADLTVSLDYGVDNGKERIVNDPFYDPFWGYGSFGYSRPYLVRTRHGARYVHGYYDPFLFGGYGYGYRGGYGVDSYTVFTGNIDLKIRRNADSQNVFEGKAEAKSRSNKLAYLVPNLVEAMFTGFPGNNGETVRISVAPEPRR